MLRDKLLIGALGRVPKNALSRAVGAAAHANAPGLMRRGSVWAFARYYGLNMDEAERGLGEYDRVGALFTRRLKPGLRPIDQRPGVAVSPADGKLLNQGRVREGRLIQAKGRTFSVAELLRSEAEAEAYMNGSWATVYLSPRDYHRVHHPVEGVIRSARYVPGHLWPVNRAAVENVEGVFCINERIITYVDSPIGDVATIMVGATSVGYITVAYDPELVSNRDRAGGLRRYSTPTKVERGDELGIFHLGSTAIVLFADPKVRLSSREAHSPIRLGEAIASRP